MFGIINIYSKSKNEISRKLSNFYPHRFVFDGQVFPCFEAFIQCLKVSDPDEQLAVAQLEAKAAKAKGQARNWQASGWLYWKGEPVNRYSKAYRLLLEKAYDALCKNEDFADALCKSREHILIHSIGKLRKKETVLTPFELSSILMKKRRKLLREKRMEAGKKICP